jgi:hypothetical protein
MENLIKTLKYCINSHRMDCESCPSNFDDKICEAIPIDNTTKIKLLKYLEENMIEKGLTNEEEVKEDQKLGHSNYQLNPQMSIIDIIQEYVNNYVNRNFYFDTDCPPEFIVSTLIDNEDRQNIILTIDHCERISVQLFPQKLPNNNIFYGLDSINPIIDDLYTQTM